MNIKKTNIDFVKYLQTLLNQNTIYMWGEYGNKLTIERINKRKNQYPNHYPKEKIEYLKTLTNNDYYGYDCSGLIKSFFMSEFGTKKIKYNREYEINTKRLLKSNSAEKGSIQTLPEMPGIILWMEGHCGIYLGKKKVIECTSNELLSNKKYGGICITKLSDRNWKMWTKTKWLKYI